VFHAVRLLEDVPIFNAGTGSKLQSDGVARMTASIMDSEENCLSGVINIRDVQHPIDVADMLSHEESTVLAADEATFYASLKGFTYHNPMTEMRLREYNRKLSGAFGTVGAVALDGRGIIAAATSTGGRGHEMPGRVSDSATVAGNYVTKKAGVSCTGIGEHIVNHATAARVAVRVGDGMSLEEAVTITIKEANDRQYSFALIAVDSSGHAMTGITQGLELIYAQYDGSKLTCFV
jgi:L-asparaginase